MESMTDSSGISALTDGIGRALDGAFEGAAIYADREVEQGLTPPAFFVSVLTPSRIPELGARYRMRNPFDILYFPAVDGDNAELHRVAGRLFDVLALVALEGGALARGTEMSYEVADGVLHFFVTYSLSLIKYTAGEAMENLEAEVQIEKG